MKYCCVVVTYNRLALLKECINALENQIKKFDKVFIINNNSTDGTDQYLEIINKELFKIINLSQNIGGAGGFYEGMRHFSNDYDYCLLIDDDAILAENFLLELSKYVENEEYKEFKAFSGTVIVDNSIDITHRRIITNNVTLKTKNVDINDYSKDCTVIDLASFCGLLINYSLKEKIGLPKKDFFIWYDDTEYCFRINKYSKILNINKAILNHKTKLEDNNKQFSWKSYYGYRNSYVTGVMHSSRKSIYKIYSVFKLMLLNIYYFFLFLFGKDKKNTLLKMKAHNKAYCDGKHNKLGINEVYYPGAKF